MLSRRLSHPSLNALAVVCGAALGVVLGQARGTSPWVPVVEAGCDLAAAIGLAWLRVLAVPLIVSSIILGAVGLEPMRGLSVLARKTLVWMGASNLVAVLTAIAVAWLAGPGLDTPLVLHKDPVPAGPPPFDAWAWGWPGLVLLSLGLGYYRNQLAEHGARLFVRFCQGLDETLAFLLGWTRRALPLGLFFFAVAATAAHAPFLRSLPNYGPTPSPSFYARGLVISGVTALVYVGILMATVWRWARVSPWKFGGSLIPAMLAAASTGSLEAALPMSLDAARRRLGISNRVASVVLPILAVLHRDGLALGWTSAAFCLAGAGSLGTHWNAVLSSASMAFLAGCGVEPLSGHAALLSTLVAGETGLVDRAGYGFALGWIIASVGGIVSVFSQGCAAVVIARSEGEYWVPGPPPSSDEVQRLKAELQSADE